MRRSSMISICRSTRFRGKRFTIDGYTSSAMIYTSYRWCRNISGGPLTVNQQTVALPRGWGMRCVPMRGCGVSLSTALPIPTVPAAPAKKACGAALACPAAIFRFCCDEHTIIGLYNDHSTNIHQAPRQIDSIHARLLRTRLWPALIPSVAPLHVSIKGSGGRGRSRARL